MKPIRIWYQSYVDYDNGKTYWDRLRKHLDDIVEPANIAGIEIYRSPAELPARFGGAESACGVIVIWTRVRA